MARNIEMVGRAVSLHSQWLLVQRLMDIKGRCEATVFRWRLVKVLIDCYVGTRIVVERVWIFKRRCRIRRESHMAWRRLIISALHHMYGRSRALDGANSFAFLVNAPRFPFELQ